LYDSGASRRGNAELYSSAVMPRFMRGIQYAVTSRMSATVSGILDRTVRPGDDAGAGCSRIESENAQAYAAFAFTLSQNSARRSASRSVAGLASGDAISATSVRSIGAKPSLAVNTR
jgi:hypothetical protein